MLIYDYEVVLDGKTLPRPINKMLLKILPPEGHGDARTGSAPT